MRLKSALFHAVFIALFGGAAFLATLLVRPSVNYPQVEETSVEVLEVCKVRNGLWAVPINAIAGGQSDEQAFALKIRKLRAERTAV